MTDVPFNDAYRYRDWVPTVPLPLMEIPLVMYIVYEQLVGLAATMANFHNLFVYNVNNINHINTHNNHYNCYQPTQHTILAVGFISSHLLHPCSQ